MRFEQVYSIGFWGAPNLGDELLCFFLNKIVVNSILEPNGTHYLLTRNFSISNNYISTEKSKYVEGFFPSPEYFVNYINHLSAVCNSNLITIGGGGLISDKYTWQAIPRYFVDVLLAIALNKRVALVGVGVLPLKNFFLRKIIKFTIPNLDYMYLRDADSIRNLECIVGYSLKDQCTLGPDISVACHIRDLLEASVINTKSNESYVVINFREKPYISIDGIRKIVDLFIDYEYKVYFLCAEPSDKLFYQKVIEFMGLPKEKVVISEPDNLLDAVKIIHGAEFVFSERLHITALSAELGKKSMYLLYENKVTEFLKNNYKNYSSIQLSEFNEIDFEVDKIKFIVPTKNDKISNNVLDLIKEIGEIPIAKRSIAIRGIAFSTYSALLVFGSFYAIMIKIKRLVFGRGMISFFGKKYG